MMQGFKAEQIRRALAGTGRGDLNTVQVQIERVRHELADLAEMLGGAAQDRIPDGRLLTRAEAMRAKAADQISATASRANETVRQHPASAASGLAIVIGIGLLAALLSRR